MKQAKRSVVSSAAMLGALSLAATSLFMPVASAHAAAKPRVLVLYAAEGYDAAMAKAFQQKTGIIVKLVDMSTGPLVAKIQAERSNPHWDLAWFDGDSTMQSLDNQGLLLRGFTPSDIHNYTPLGNSLLPRDHAYFPTGVTASTAFGYNPKVLPPSQVPTTLQGLLSSNLRGEIAMNDPSISGPTYPFVAGVMQQMGLAKGKQFFLKLKQNGLHIYRTNKVTLRALLAGREKLIWIQDSALISAKKNGDPIAIAYPKSGTYTLPGVLSIDRHAPDLAAAKEFVAFALSQQGQRVMVNPANGGGDSYYNPIIKGINPNPARQQSGIHWIRVNPIWASRVEGSLQAWFHDNITL